MSRSYKHQSNVLFWKSFKTAYGCVYGKSTPEVVFVDNKRLVSFANRSNSFELAAVVSQIFLLILKNWKQIVQTLF